MKFLIQTINGELVHDFSFSLIENIKYNNWYYNDNSLSYVLSDSIHTPDCIPIGTVEYVHDYLNHYYNKVPSPLNVPAELLNEKYTCREIYNCTDKKVNNLSGIYFVKSNDKIKGFTSVCDRFDVPVGNYQVSSLIDIRSEWRSFVYKGDLIGLQNYSGDFTIFPDVSRIKEMINDYKSKPVAFTLDVAITGDNETVIIEVHNFYSCGLYGFNDSKLSTMFSRWFHEYIKLK